MTDRELSPGDVTNADLEAVEWLKVTSESLLGDSTNYWEVGEKLVEVYRGEDGEQTDTTKMFDEAVTALNNDEDSSAAAEVVDIESVTTDEIPDEVDA
jgi:hypothetical protein